MDYTIEQQEAIDIIKKEDCKLLKINSVAGSGKTTMLVEIAKHLEPQKGLYISYNKAIAEEAKERFPKNVKCMTIHSLAFRNTVSKFKFTLGVLNFKTIDDPYTYLEKRLIADEIKKFYMSKFVKVDEFLKEREHLSKPTKREIKKTIIEIFSGKKEISHDGYLKLYHILLKNNKIKYKEHDLVLLDESNDVSVVTLDIFQLLKAKKKVMVGDVNQNIYGFNNTVNGFEILKDEGELVKMTNSFRCEASIASKIERFGKENFGRDFSFVGVSMSEKTISDIKTEAYISRTNASLINKIIECKEHGIDFSLTRTPSVIFSLMLTLANLKEDREIMSREWRFMNRDIKEFYGSKSLCRIHKDSALNYICDKYSDDDEIQRTSKTVISFGSKIINEAFAYAKFMYYDNKNKAPLCLCTSHSAKGLEFDRVFIADDLTRTIVKKEELIIEIIDKQDGPLSKETKELVALIEKDIEEEKRLYYVACSRAKKKLENAKLLD